LTDGPRLRIIRAVGRDLPSGTVTFLFTDVEGSTKLLHALGTDAYADALAGHRRVPRGAFTAHGGVEVDTQGDAFFVAFPTAPGALAAAAQAREALGDGPIQVRIGLHTGTPHLTDEGYVGADVHRAARIAAAGHGGQILVSSATAALVGTDGLRDLGEHRLKDLTAPERIYQLGDDQHPPLKTLSNTNLPHLASTFVGREREVADLLERLGGSARLVTLTGPGGTGKTRLALEAAADLVPSFPGGVFWVPLAAVRDSALVAAEIARTIGAKEGLAEGIGDREMLLLLDNFEQVTAAAPELAELLERCPNVRLLVTSRELLRVRGESEFAVPPLATTDAIALFEARAKFVDADVPELCRRLDDLPLAVELAAARARVLSPAQILDRLGSSLDLFRGGRDAVARQATLRRTIEWSHELLDPEEQELFARLAAFHGGWTLEAAEEVTDAGIDTLGSLAEKSLIVRAEARFRMLETIRTYAEERLVASGEEHSCRRRHLEYFANVAEGWYEQRFSSESRLLAAISAENGNLRAAVDWAQEHAPATELAMVGALSPLWSLNGQAIEARTRLTAALGHGANRDAPRARALMHLGELDDDLGRLDEALGIWRELDDREGEAAALEAIGWVHDALGDYAAAEVAHEASLAVRRAVGSPEVRGLAARAGLCHVLVARSETGRAGEVAAELLAIARAHDATLMEELALHFLADCPLVDGDHAEAERRYLTALAFADHAGLVRRATDEVLGVAMARAGLGRSADALRLAACAHAKQAEIAQGTDAWWASMQNRLLGLARNQLSDGARERAESTGRAVSFEALTRELVSGEIGAHAPS
jgi:predicted ATPase/class 3 adenylate cyclase